MRLSTASPSPATDSPRRWIWLAAGGVILATAAAYHNTFHGPMVFDDQIVIVDNATIRDLRHLGDILATPRDGSGAAGRPLLNLSFALNYACGGLNVVGYHAVNLLLHTASALVLLGLVRRTLLQPRLAARCGEHALPLASAIAGVWAVHPLNTESVTCISQRTELLVAFFYLAALYALARASDEPGRSRWPTIAVACCLLGMASKEVMATLPVVALLYDRTFLAGSFRGAWQRRRKLHLALMSTWLLLGIIVVRMGGSRGDAAGFGLGMTPWSYALKQCEAILHYLRLAFWPRPLVLDYGTDVIHDWRAVWPQGIALLALLSGTVWALVRRPELGFCGAWFFIILGPSSSFIPLVAQTMAEHRMYLPLVAVLTVAVIALYRVSGTWTRWWWVVPAIVFAAMTVERNKAYATELGLWRDTVAKRPENPRAHLCLGMTLMNHGESDEAVAALLEVLLLDRTHATAHNALGQLFAARGWTEDAIEHYEIALQGNVDRAAIHSNLCDALRTIGRLPEALRHGEEAVRLNPRLAAAQANLALVLATLGREAEAMPHYAEAVRLDPQLASAHNNYGVALLNAGRLAEARRELNAALQLAPDLAAAHNTLGAVFDRLGEKDAAIAQFELALRCDPQFEGARRNLKALREAAAPIVAPK